MRHHDETKNNSSSYHFLFSAVVFVNLLMTLWVSVPTRRERITVSFVLPSKDLNVCRKWRKSYSVEPSEHFYSVDVTRYIHYNKTLKCTFYRSCKYYKCCKIHNKEKDVLLIKMYCIIDIHQMLNKSLVNSDTCWLDVEALFTCLSKGGCYSVFLIGLALFS